MDYQYFRIEENAKTVYSIAGRRRIRLVSRQVPLQSRYLFRGIDTDMDPISGEFRASRSGRGRSPPEQADTSSCVTVTHVRLRSPRRVAVGGSRGAGPVIPPGACPPAGPQPGDGLRRATAEGEGPSAPSPDGTQRVLPRESMSGGRPDVRKRLADATRQFCPPLCRTSYYI